MARDEASEQQAMTAERLAEMRERFEAATPGPWQCWDAWELVQSSGGSRYSDAVDGAPSGFLAMSRLGPVYDTSRGDYGIAATVTRSAIFMRRENAEFICAAFQDVPELLADNERLRAELAAKSDSYERLHLINELLVRHRRAREAELLTFVERVARLDESVEIDRDDGGQWVTSHDIRPLAEEARALLASTLASTDERSGGDGA